MGIFEDVRAMATGMSALPHSPIQARVSFRAKQRLRAMAQAYNVTEEEICTAILTAIADHAEHLKVMIFDASDNDRVLFSEVVARPDVILDDLLVAGYTVHLSRESGPEEPAFRAWIGASQQPDVEARGPSLGGAIRLLLSRVRAMDR